MNKFRRILSGVVLSAFVVTLAGFPSSAEASQVDVLIEKMVEKGMLTRLDAETMKAEVETAEKKDFKQQVKDSTPWIEGLKSSGDIRLRTEGFTFDHKKQQDRLRYRFRLRWGLEKKINDEWKAGFRLASGTNTDAASTNQTFDDEFSFKDVFIEKAYVNWYPTAYVKEFMPNTEKFEIGGGKFTNPHEKYSTSLIWDGDVVPEGLYEAWDFKVADLDNGGSMVLNTLLGQYVLEEQETKIDIHAYAYMAGLSTKFDEKGTRYINGNYTFYDWGNYAEVLRPSASSNSTIDTSHLTGTTPGGNEAQVDEFKVHSIYLEAGWPVQTGIVGEQPFKLFGQYIVNAGDIGAVVYPNEDMGWTLGGQLGKAKKKGEWDVVYQYYHLEKNATAGNFTESDLGTGFTNNQGSKVGYKYMLLDNLEFNWTNWFVDNIIDPAGVTAEQNVWRTQADVVAKF